MARHVRPQLNTPNYVLVALAGYRKHQLDMSALQGPASSVAVKHAEFQFYPLTQLAGSVTYTQAPVKALHVWPQLNKPNLF